MLKYMFPLYKDDNISIEVISKDRKKAVIEFENKVRKKEFRYIINNCICGNTNPHFDIVLSLKDRFGISIKFLLCKKCSIVRTSKKLERTSLSSFYTSYYRKIYGNDLASIKDEYTQQSIKGELYRSKISKYINFENVESIFDFGCGTGGVLSAFLNKNISLYGSDYNMHRLEYGRERNLNLYHAVEDKEIITSQQYDLIILSHVLEHLSEPLIEINDIFEMIKEGGHIYIIVPSPLNIGKSPAVTYKFFQNIHLYNYNKKYLETFFQNLGMEIIFINEICECILRKPKLWHRNNLIKFNDESLSLEYVKILFHFRNSVILHDILKISTIRLKLINLLDFLGIKKYIKNKLGFDS